MVLFSDCRVRHLNGFCRFGKTINFIVLNVFYFFSRLFILFSLALVIHSCQKRASSEWGPDVAVPMVKGRFSLANILVKSNAGGNFLTGSDGLITLYYQRNLANLVAESQFPLVSQGFSQSFGLDASSAAAFNTLDPGLVFDMPTINQVMNLNLPIGIELDSLILKGGTLRVNVSSGFQHPALFTVSLPGSVQNGAVISTNLQLSMPGTGPSQGTSVLNLSGARLNTRAGGQPNRLAVQFQVQFTKTANPVSVSDSLLVSFEIQQPRFSKLIGFMGNTDFPLPQDTLEIPVLSQALGGNFIVSNPKLEFAYRNGFGLPVLGQFLSSQAYYPSPNTPSASLTGSWSAPFTIAAAISGVPVSSGFDISSANSNILSLIQQVPRGFIFNLKATPNPGATSGQNIILDTAHFKLDMGIRLPLQGRLEQFTFLDTVPLTLTNLGRIDRITFRTTIANAFPVGCKFQAYFMNAQYQILDSLNQSDTSYVVAPPQVNSAGVVVGGPAEKTTDFQIEAGSIARLNGVKYMLLVATATTSGAPSTNVSFFNYNYMDVRFGIRTKLKIKI